jgi:hypothetical protein
MVVPARLFEGAAGGAVLLGTAPQCPEFQSCFDWPDAVIEVSPEATDIAAVIDELDTQSQRMERVRHTNAIRCLLQHDWVYRWQRILSTVGMASHSKLDDRKKRLGSIAVNAMAGSPHGVSLAPQEKWRI